MRRIGFLGFLPLCLLACGDPLYDTGYPGEPLLVIHGQVFLGEGVVAPADPRAAVVWLSAAPYGVALRADDVAIATTFPADFEVTIAEIPTEQEFPGNWQDIPYLPEVQGLQTLFGVLVAYEDVDGNTQPDFDYLGYELLDWLQGRTEDTTGILVGGDVVLGLAPDFLIAATVLPDGSANLGDAVPIEEYPDLAPVQGLLDGLHCYGFGGGAWEEMEPGTDPVALVIAGD
jgi:hypothetical protein